MSKVSKIAVAQVFYENFIDISLGKNFLLTHRFANQAFDANPVIPGPVLLFNSRSTEPGLPREMEALNIGWSWKACEQY